MQVTPEDFVHVPHHCNEEYDDKTGGICWTDISKVRRILNDKDRNAEGLIRETVSAVWAMAGREFVDESWSPFKGRRHVFRGPIIVFFFGLFLMFTIPNRQNQTSAS